MTEHKSRQNTKRRGSTRPLDVTFLPSDIEIFLRKVRCRQDKLGHSYCHSVPQQLKSRWRDIEDQTRRGDDDETHIFLCLSVSKDLSVGLKY